MAGYSIPPIVSSVNGHRKDMSKAIKQGFQVMASAVVPERHTNQSLPKIAEILFPQHFPSATSAKKACRRGELMINGVEHRRGSVVIAGDTVQWIQRSVAPPRLNSEDAPVIIHTVYEDDDIACVIKPPGIPTQARRQSSVNDCLKYWLQPSQVAGALHRPQTVHRLDEPTGGVLLAAKTRIAVQGLSKAFAERQVGKRYRAVVRGALAGEGRVEAELDGKAAVTTYKSIRTWSTADGMPWASVVDMWPHTGRTHQLRRHMSLIGHPLMHDPRYTYGYIKTRTLPVRHTPHLHPPPIQPALGHTPQVHPSSTQSPAPPPQSPEDDPVTAPALSGAASAPLAVRDDACNGHADATDSQECPVGRAETDSGSGEVHEGPPQGLLHDGEEVRRVRTAVPSTYPANVERLCLWAVEVVVRHPVTGEVMAFEIEEPPVVELMRRMGSATEES